MLSTLIAVVLICYGAWKDKECYENQNKFTFDIEKLFNHLGIFLFSFGGHSTFPTIQVDMKKPDDFNKSSIFAFISRL